MGRSRALRVWAMAWAVLQFALPAAATIADAHLERESARGAKAHVESRSAPACRAAHSAECGLCQFVSRTAAPPPATARPEIVVGRMAPPPAWRETLASTERARLHGARGPPVG